MNKSVVLPLVLVLFLIIFSGIPVNKAYNLCSGKVMDIKTQFQKVLSSFGSDDTPVIMRNRREFDHIGNFNFRVEIESATNGNRKGYLYSPSFLDLRR